MQSEVNHGSHDIENTATDDGGIGGTSAGIPCALVADGSNLSRKRYAQAGSGQFCPGMEGITRWRRSADQEFVGGNRCRVILRWKSLSPTRWNSNAICGTWPKNTRTYAPTYNRFWTNCPVGIAQEI